MTDRQKQWLSYVVVALAVAVAGYLGVAYPSPQTPSEIGAGEISAGIESISLAKFRSVFVEHNLTTAGTDNVTGNLKVGNGTPSTTLNGEDAYVEGTFEVDGALNFDGAADFASTITTAVGQEHVGSLPTIASANVATTTTDGALFTVGSGEIWIVHGIWVNVTTNFDCTGDDCTLIIGDGNDTDGFIVLADAELQTADTEGTGFAAGWQGMAAATRGVYFDEAANNAFTGGFVYAAADTIDVDVGGTSVAAGAATVYILYTRIQ